MEHMYLSKKSDDDNYQKKDRSFSQYLAFASGVALAAGIYLGWPYLSSLDKNLEKKTPGVHTLSDKIRDIVGTIDSSK